MQGQESGGSSVIGATRTYPESATIDNLRSEAIDRKSPSAECHRPLEVSRECCWADTISKYCCTVPKTCLVCSKKGVKMTLVCTQGERLRPLPPTSPRSGPFVDGFPLHTLIFELIDFEGLVWVRLALLRRGILFVALARHRHQPLCVLLYQTAVRLYPKVLTTTGAGPGSLRGATRKDTDIVWPLGLAHIIRLGEACITPPFLRICHCSGFLHMRRLLPR